MTITNIKPLRKGLSALYIDGEFALKLDTETLLSHRVDVGAEIDDDKLHELIESSNTKRAKDKALWFISYRDHSKRELIDKVSRHSSKDAAIKAVERLEQLGLINDENFASRYAQELIFTKRMSKSGAVRKLVEKGINKDLAKEVVDNIDCDINENICAVIDKKYVKYLSDEKGRRKAYNGLLRLGYSHSDIKHALSQYTDIDEQY